MAFYYRYGSDVSDHWLPSISTQPASVVIDYYEEPSEEEEKTVEKGRKYAARRAILLGNLAGVAATIEREQRRRKRDQHPGQVPRSLAWGMKKAHARRRPQQGKREE